MSTEMIELGNSQVPVSFNSGAVLTQAKRLGSSFLVYELTNASAFDRLPGSST